MIGLVHPSSIHGTRSRLPTRPLRRDPLSSRARTYLSGVHVSLEVGSTLESYKVTALIGEGGMGQVYQATDTKLNRQVALTILL